MRRTLALVLLTLAEAAATTALLPITAEAATIFGGYDCGQWVNRPRGRSHPAESWLLGYLSGMNVAHYRADLSPKNPLDVLNSADQAYVWMDNFCRANPLRQLDGAAVELFDELRAKKR
jgi:hypothetical protein